MRDTTRKFGKQEKYEGGEQAKQSNAPERTRRHIKGKNGRKNKRGNSRGAVCKEKREQGQKSQTGKKKQADQRTDDKQKRKERERAGI